MPRSLSNGSTWKSLPGSSPCRLRKLSGLLLGRLGGALGWVKHHFVLIVGGSAVIIGAFGLLLMFDELSRLSLHLQTWLTDAHLKWLVELG